MASLPRNHDSSGNWRSQEPDSRLTYGYESPSTSLAMFFPSSANSSPCSFISAKEDVDELELVQYDFSIPRHVTGSWVGSGSGSSASEPGSGSGSRYGSGANAKPQTTETSLSPSCSPNTSGPRLYLPHPCRQEEVSKIGSKPAYSLTNTMGCESTDHDHLRYDYEHCCLHRQQSCDIIPSSSAVSSSAIIDQHQHQQGHGTKTNAPINNDVTIDIDARDPQTNNDSRSTSVSSTVSSLPPLLPRRPWSHACDCANMASCCTDTLSFVPAQPLSSKSIGVTHLPSPTSLPPSAESALPHRRYRTISSTLASLDLPSAFHQVSGFAENTSASNKSGRWIVDFDACSNESNTHLSGGSVKSQEPRRVRIQSAGHLLPSTLTMHVSPRPFLATLDCDPSQLAPQDTAIQIHPRQPESPLLASCHDSHHPSHSALPTNGPCNIIGFISTDINDAARTPSTPKNSGSGSGSGSSSASSPFLTPMPSTSIKWASPRKKLGKSSTSMMSQALEAESNQYRQQQLGLLSNSRMLSVGLGSNKAHNFYRRRGKLGFDKLPREIRVHVFRYLTTFQLIRVSRVSRAWRNIALDGSLWKVIDTTRYYKTIQDDQLLNLGVSASGFLRYVNFRGCAQLSSDSLSMIAEHCPNVERLDLTGCRQLSSKALADVCMNMTSLIHLDLASLSAVNNYTLQAMAVYCRSLRVLNLAWCRHITGAGLSKLTKSCQELQKLNVSGCSGMEDRWMPTMGMNLPRLKELCLNGCQSLTDRGLIGLLSGLSVGLTKKYRKRRIVRRLSSSIRVATLGEDPLVNYSSSCLDDNDYDEDDEDSLDDMDKGRESDNEASDLNDDDTEEGAEGAQGGPGLSGPSQSAPLAHQEGLQTRLRYLGLSLCRQLTQEALRAVGHHCSRHLRRLEISGCENFGDEGLVYLAQHCTGLRLLDLEDDRLLTDASLRAFGMHLPHLERICLSYCENITDQGVLRMLKPLTVNPNTPVNMAVNPDKFCSKLAHLELDNCLLVTDRLLLEFAKVLEDRRIKAIEKQREKERKREERRERIRQKKKKPVCGSEHHDEDEDNLETDRRHKLGRSESSLRSLVEIVQNSMPSTSSHAAYPSSVEERARPPFISSAPVNIPTAPYRYHPALAAAAAASTSSFSSSPSPLQPRGVMASTSVSEEMAIKKAGQKPILRIITPTRFTSTSSTTSFTSSSSLPLWPSALQSRRAMPPRSRVKKPQPPTIQVFDCRNMSLEGVEAAQKKCESLVIKSYYSWTNPRTPTAVSTTRARRSYSSTSSSFGATVSSSGYFGSSYGGIEFGEEEEEDDDEDGTEDDEEAASAGNSHSSLHQLQLQHQQHQHPQRARSLFHRARLGLVGRGRDRGHQCHIL